MGAEIIDAATLELRRIEHVKRLRDEAGCSGELLGNLLRVLRVVTGSVTRWSRYIGVKVGVSSTSAV